MELLEGIDSQRCESESWKNKKYFRRAVNQLYPTDVRLGDPREQNLSRTKDTINDKINKQYNSKRTIRPRRDPAVTAELHIRLNETDAYP